MMGSVHPFPSPAGPSRGTIHVGGDSLDGFRVSHERASGGSWGSFLGPFRDAADAITAAYALNRDQYAGACDVSVCEAAVVHANPNVELSSWPGDF